MRNTAHTRDELAGQVRSFEIDIANDVLDDLWARLDRTRWIAEMADGGWEFGVSVPYMRALVAFWRRDFDWRLQERMMNGFSPFAWRSTAGALTS